MKIEEIVKAKFQTAQQKALVNLKYTANFLGNIQTNFVSSHGLSMAQFNILRILRGANGEINVNTVKERMIEKSPNTTRLMDKLIEKELVIRWKSELDRRVVLVSITKKGLAVLRQIDQDNMVDNLSSIPLSEEEANQLNSLLDKSRGA
jgi:DNA-binding MarR family transcriptional regulator